MTDFDQLSHDTRAIQKRHLQHVRRQTEDATAFNDEHYPTFYGADFSNVKRAPFLHSNIY